MKIVKNRKAYLHQKLQSMDTQELLEHFESGEYWRTIPYEEGEVAIGLFIMLPGTILALYALFLALASNQPW